MLAGHLGIAQIARAVRREAPIGWLLVAAYLPDLVRALGTPFSPQNSIELYSHSIPAVATLAILVAGAWVLRGGTIGGACAIMTACVLHLAADVITRCK